MIHKETFYCIYRSLRMLFGYLITFAFIFITLCVAPHDPGVYYPAAAASQREERRPARHGAHTVLPQAPQSPSGV